METPTVDYMCFQMGPLQSIFLLCVNVMNRLKRVYLDHFITNSVNSGDQAQTALVIDGMSCVKLRILMGLSPSIQIAGKRETANIICRVHRTLRRVRMF